MSTLCFFSQFTANKVGVNGLTVTWDIERITRADGTRSALVTGGANGVTIGRRGLYGYVLSNADLSLYDYVATAITADTTVDQKEVAAVWTLWSISWYDIATSLMTLAGSIGKLFTDNINATIGSRSTLTASQVWATLTSALTTPGSVGAWILDKLDVKVSSVSVGSVPTPAQIWNWPWRTTTIPSQADVPMNTLQAYTYNTFYYPVLALGSLANYTTLFFTVKESKKDTDAASVLQISKRLDGVGDGLQVVLGQPAGDKTKGSITIDSLSDGNLTLTVDDTIMALLKSGKYFADIKILRSSGVKSEMLREFTFLLNDTTTKAI